MVLCKIEVNEIMVDPTKNRTEEETMHTYQSLIDLLHTKCIFPKKQVLENEASSKYKGAMKKSGMEYELLSPHMHCKNLAERDIQKIKDTFVGILCGLPSSFP